MHGVTLDVKDNAFDRLKFTINHSITVDARTVVRYHSRIANPLGGALKSQYSITEARSHFAAIVYNLKPAHPVQIIRHGRVVAILMSVEEYERRTSTTTDFWNAYERFRATVDLPSLQIEPDIFEGMRITD